MPLTAAPAATGLLITNARVIDPASGTDAQMDVAVEGGRIAAIGKNLSASNFADSSNVRVVNACDKILAPGLIDPHVHLREPGQEHKETIATGSRAAAVGGFTSVCCMPNTAPALDTPELVAFVAHRAQNASCRVFPVAAATKGRKGEDLTEIALLARAGAVAISDDGDCIPTPGMMARVMAAVAPTGLCFMQHCQEPTMTRGSSMHAGAISVKLGLGGWPRVAEELIIERDVRLSRATKCRYHVQHISSGESVEIVRRARKEGHTHVTAEASPHHLTLTHEACENYNTLAKVNPPLREQKDLEAIRQGVADGTITVLATDHAPHAIDEKQLPFDEAPFGFIGLETALPLYIESLVTTGLIKWPKLIELLTINPAKLCNLHTCGLGTLTVGGPADLTVIDPNHRWTVSRQTLASKSINTPYLGRTMVGRAALTVVGGRVVQELA